MDSMFVAFDASISHNNHHMIYSSQKLIMAVEDLSITEGCS